MTVHPVFRAHRVGSRVWETARGPWLHPFRASVARQVCRPVILLGLALVVALVVGGCVQGGVLSRGQGWEAVKVSQGKLYVGTVDGEVWALDTKALEKNEGADALWRFSPDKEQRINNIYGPPAVGDNKVFVAGSTDNGKKGKIYALAKGRTSSNRIGEQEGEEWERTLDCPVVAAPVLAQGLVLLGCGDGFFYALNAANGEIVRRFATEGSKSGNRKERHLWATAVVEGDKVYFGAMDGYVYALSVAGGQELWRHKTGGAVVSTPLVVDGKIIVGSFDRKLYALDSRDNGRELWTFKGDNWFWAGAVSDGKRVYAANMDGKIYALSLKGEMEWVSDLRSPISATPFLAGDKLVVGTEEGRLHLLSTKNGIAERVFIEGEPKIRAPLSGEETSSGATVFVGDVDGNVRGINIDKWREIWKVSTKK